METNALSQVPTNPTSLPDLARACSVRETAARLSCGQSLVWQMIAAGELKAI